MKPLYIKYNSKDFWENFWKDFGIDIEEFCDLGMYPIKLALKYAKKNDRIFECGFGGGRVIQHFAKNGYNIEGIEYDSAIVEKLMLKNPDLKISEGDIRDIHYLDNYFDTVLCFGVIGGLSYDTSNAVLELQRVTKHGGIVIVSVMLQNIARQFMRIISIVSNSSDPVQFYAWMDTEKGWKNYFNSFGFDVLECEEVVLKYNLWYWGKFLRSSKKINLQRTRIEDNEFKFNFLGQILWLIHKYFLRKEMASAMTFVLKKK